MNQNSNISQDVEVRKGPWTMEEDFILINYIANHGEGVWNSLARSAGLKRTGKSCRLRWLNYLRPDIRRGNITHEEELLIMELHAKWGNRWSKIAKHLPGRTDNEIKNYWRTRIQKHLKQIDQITTNSGQSSGQSNSDHNQHHHHYNHPTSISPVSISTSTSTSTYNLNTVDPFLPSTSVSYSESHMDINFAPSIPQENNVNFWSVDEDLWSVQLFNGNQV